MIRLFLISTLFISFATHRLHGVAGYHSPSHSYIRTPNVKLNSMASTGDVNQAFRRTSRAAEKSSTYMQSRRFHADQYARDVRDLHHPSSLTAPISSSYFYSYSNPGIHSVVSSAEPCRLTDNTCSADYQCCSGKCRCVRWSSMGQTSCLKKCF